MFRRLYIILNGCVIYASMGYWCNGSTLSSHVGVMEAR